MISYISREKNHRIDSNGPSPQNQPNICINHIRSTRGYNSETVRQPDRTWHRSEYCRRDKNISVRSGICMRRSRPVTWQPIDESFPARHTAHAHCVPFPTSRRVRFPVARLMNAPYFELWTFSVSSTTSSSYALHQLTVVVRYSKWTDVAWVETRTFTFSFLNNSGKWHTSHNFWLS